MWLMAYSTRLYLTKITHITPQTLDTTINQLTRVPYLANVDFTNSESYWSLIDNNDGGDDVMVAVHTDDARHATIENDPLIVRIDDL